MSNRETIYLLKFFLVSAGSFFIGTVHGMVQVMPPVRTWLEQIGTPLHNPGHMIDPLAHAHINLVGGLAIFSMGVIYYFLTMWNNGRVFSKLLVNVSFWCTTLGVAGFYTSHLYFGIIEGMYVHERMYEAKDALHAYYGPVIASFATVMAIGFLIYALNVLFTAIEIFSNNTSKHDGKSTS